MALVSPRWNLGGKGDILLISFFFFPFLNFTQRTKPHFEHFHFICLKRWRKICGRIRKMFWSGALGKQTTKGILKWKSFQTKDSELLTENSPLLTVDVCPQFTLPSNSYPHVDDKTQRKHLGVPESAMLVGKNSNAQIFLLLASRGLCGKGPLKISCRQRRLLASK